MTHWVSYAEEVWFQKMQLSPVLTVRKFLLIPQQNNHQLIIIQVSTTKIQIFKDVLRKVNFLLEDTI